MFNMSFTERFSVIMACGLILLLCKEFDILGVYTMTDWLISMVGAVFYQIADDLIYRIRHIK